MKAATAAPISLRWSSLISDAAQKSFEAAPAVEAALNDLCRDIRRREETAAAADEHGPDLIEPAVAAVSDIFGEIDLRFKVYDQRYKYRLVQKLRPGTNFA